MGLNKEQQAAVEYLDGPLLVLAGPGTGKTQLLSAKVAYILENIDVNPENILCLTFTDAGAENMRARLQTMIGKAALDVNIHTYHSFGSNILERYKSYAENFNRKLDTPIDETLQYKIISEIQKSLPAMDIMRDSDTKDIISTISSAKAARLTSADLQKIAEQNIEDSRNLSMEISPILLSLKSHEKFDIAVETVYQPILEILLENRSTEPITKNIERIANILAKDLYQVIETASAAEKPKTSELTKWKTKYFELYVEDPKHPEHKAYRLKDSIANKKLFSLANIMRKYEEKLEAAGLFDFNDMIECAIQYLKEDTGFRLHLSEQFQYILLDEFQDTNASQFELIKLLTDYEQPIVMAVGDDDQAIFEFQGANASNLSDFRAHYGAEFINLIDNYRSTGEVLSLSHCIAEQITDSFAKNHSVNKVLRSMRDEWAGDDKITLQVSRHEFPSSEAEYYWIAQEIRKLLDAGEDPTDIAIIAPKHKNIAPILPYLKARDIDVTYEKRDNILKDEKMSIIIQLAKFVHRLARREQPVENLLEILSYPFWQVPPSVAIQAVEQKWGTNKTILEYLSGDPQLEEIASFLASLATIAETTPLELWLDYLIGNQELNGYKSPILEYYQSQVNQAELLEFYENLNTFRQKVLQHAHSLHPEDSEFTPKLADFVTTMEDFQLADAQIVRISIYRDSGRAIQVMTSHKSKGLEFKHVFLTSVDDASWGKGKGNNNKLTLPCNLTQIRHTGITDDEQLRLFFVAITRAKEHLIMTSSERNADGGDIKRLRYLNESSRDDSEQKSPYLLPEIQKIFIHRDELSPDQKIETMRLGWIGAYQKLEPNVMEILRERMKDYRLSASDITSFIDVIYGGPQSMYQSRILRSPSEPATFSMCYGNLIHEVFEQVTAQKIDDTAAIDLFHSEAQKAILNNDEKKDLLEKGEESLKIALREFDQILRHDNAKAEVNFSPERLNIDGVPVSGKIDHININPETKTIELYDFKTGNYHAEKWNSHPTLYKYRLQLGFYKLLLNHSLNYRNYKVTRGHILFVTPDSEDRVYDKVYEFDDHDEQELKQIMKAVYHQMTSLGFLSDDELFITADKSRTMKKMKQFIEKLLEKSEISA